MTDGDGVCNVNKSSILDFHLSHGLKATLTAVTPPGRFGALDFQSDSRVLSFKEKPKGDGGFINGGFFVLSPQVLDYIEDDSVVWEGQPLERLAREGSLKAYLHEGFWQCMDTLRDKQYLEELWSKEGGPWKVWP